ncbi:MAG: hypothetical protein ACRDRK_10385 [Pseudonocardia sp.]
MSLSPRILGAATAAYGVAALVPPRVLARPVGMVEPDGGPEARGKSAVIAGAWSALCALSLLTTRNAR